MIRMKQLEVPLPNTRLNNAHPFQLSGVDGCGLFLLCFSIPSPESETPRRSRRMMNFYIIQFVYFNYRCIHFEVLMAPISHENVLQVIHRFVSRRDAIDNRPLTVLPINAGGCFAETLTPSHFLCGRNFIQMRCIFKRVIEPPPCRTRQLGNQSFAGLENIQNAKSGFYFQRTSTI